MSRLPPLAARAGALAILATCLLAPACDDSKSAAVGTVVVRDLNGDLSVDLTYPDDPAFLHLDVYVGYTPARLAPEDFGTQTAAHATLTLLHGDGETRLPVTFRTNDLVADTIPADGTESRMLLDGGDGVPASLLAPFCGTADLALRVDVTVPDCACAGTLTTPITLTCLDDRRGGAYLALTSVPTPAGLPCRAEQVTNVGGFGDLREFGYDSAGNHLFTDLFFGDDWVERRAYDYDPIGNLAHERVVSPDSGEISRVTTYSWDLDGRLASLSRRDTLPPYASATDLYHMDGATDWNTTDALGTLRELGDWRDADQTLTITANGESIRFTFEAPFRRESWLGMTDVTRYHALRVTSATDPRGSRSWTWANRRITRDVSVVGAAEAETAWQYDDCNPR